jgi:hypothetical protein
MHDPDELRPAPRRAPSAVLWLMATVVVAGSTLLVLPPTSEPIGTLAWAAGFAPSPAAAHPPRLPASAAPAVLHKSLGALKVP